MTYSISKKSLLGFALYAVIFAGIILFLLNPTLTEIKKNKLAIIDGQKQLSANYDEIASLQKIETDKEGFEEIKNTVLGYLPATLNSSQFIVEIEGLAKKTDISIDSLSMNATSTSVDATKDTSKSSSDTSQNATDKKKKGGTQQTQFMLSTKADFGKTMSFLKQMEKLSRFNSISKISIVPAENGDTNIALTGNIFYEQ